MGCRLHRHQRQFQTQLYPRLFNTHKYLWLPHTGLSLAAIAPYSAILSLCHDAICDSKKELPKRFIQRGNFALREERRAFEKRFCAFLQICYVPRAEGKFFFCKILSLDVYFLCLSFRFLLRCCQLQFTADI